MRKILAMLMITMTGSALIGPALIGSAVAADKPAKKQPVITDQRPRVSYVAFRILDLDRSLKFYKDLLGMTERQRIPLDSGVTEILLGYGDANKDAGILLLHNPKRTEPYTHGDGYHRFIVGVKELNGLVEHLKANGVKVSRGPTRVENLKLSYAFVSDPDGYAIELVEND
jgi:lactoylglutathione lyase